MEAKRHGIMKSTDIRFKQGENAFALSLTISTTKVERGTLEGWKRKDIEIMKNTK